MHLMSKINLSSGEMDTVKKVQIPDIVLTANGEVQTHEEAQVFVHDLNLIVTVQLLDETPAVLSLGKLCEDHGYSCEWVSGRKLRLTKDGKSIICKTDNFVPGLSTNPDEPASRRLVQSPEIENQNKKRDVRKNSEHPLADLPGYRITKKI